MNGTNNAFSTAADDAGTLMSYITRTIRETWPELGKARETGPRRVRFDGRKGLAVSVSRNESGTTTIDCVFYVPDSTLPAEAMEAIAELSSHWALGWKQGTGETAPILGFKRTVRPRVPKSVWRRELEWLRNVADVLCPEDHAPLDRTNLRNAAVRSEYRVFTPGRLRKAALLLAALGLLCFALGFLAACH